MLLANRRVSLIHFCLAGMEAAWFTPLFLLMWRPGAPLWLAYVGSLAVLLTWILGLDLLSRAEIESPALDAAALGMMLLSSLFIVAAALVRTGLPLRLAFAATFDFRAGFPPVLALVVGNLILWQRATAATSRDLSFFSVGVSFRLGMLLLIAGGSVLMGLLDQDPTPLLAIYFGLGLTGVAVARIHEKATEARSAGTPLPLGRFYQLLAAVALTVGLIAALSSVYEPDNLRRFLVWLNPLWRVLEFFALILLALLGLVLNPFLTWLTIKLEQFIARFGGLQLDLHSPQWTAEQQTELLARVPSWVRTALAGVGIALLAFIVLSVVLIFLLLYLDKVRRPTLREEDEEVRGEPVTFGGGILGRGAAALRNFARLLRRYGVTTRLLAAVSVQNIYANVCRLARRRGYGRPPAQPPDIYLPTLVKAFPNCEAPLERITAAYMRVHYGDHPVALAELAALRQDYRAVRQSE